jgi:hypothetical protein
MAVTGLPVGRLSLRSQGNLLTLTLGLLKLAQLLVVGSEKTASNQKLLAGVKIGAKIQRVRAPLLDVVQCAVSQLVKLLVKPSPALALG